MGTTSEHSNSENRSALHCIVYHTGRIAFDMLASLTNLSSIFQRCQLFVSLWYFSKNSWVYVFIPKHRHLYSATLNGNTLPSSYFLFTFTFSSLLLLFWQNFFLPITFKVNKYIHTHIQFSASTVPSMIDFSLFYVAKCKH